MFKDIAFVVAHIVAMLLTGYVAIMAFISFLGLLGVI